MLRPREEVPELSLKLINGESWSTEQANEADFMTLLLFYRGYHCPVCRSYVPQLAKLVEKFENMGIRVVAASSDSKERAEKTYQEWGLDKLKLAYGLSIEEARKWGLSVSHGIKEGEPDVFSEPGLFLIKPDKSLYAYSIQSMPFTRPNLEELLQGLQYIKQNDYPARGEA
ncbi:redoxin domain-containing protein [Nafulsella turpanensis]|uniref:redoxin domain-containing protein n=1 Tax=Nafulsella turpanensis TaxID=1265690 RepID=UPI00034A2711|nr:redoxin domain-containing protein [Nafulsella turpanensis]